MLTYGELMEYIENQKEFVSIYDLEREFGDRLDDMYATYYQVNRNHTKDGYIHYSIFDSVRIKLLLILMRYVVNENLYEKLWGKLILIRSGYLNDNH